MYTQGTIVYKSQAKNNQLLITTLSPGPFFFVFCLPIGVNAMKMDISRPTLLNGTIGAS